MNFIVDAQLPRALCGVLREAGYDALHTSELPEQNRTPDRTINALSVSEQRVVISKDTDFYYSHVLYGRLYKLLLIRTGNIGVRDLCEPSSASSRRSSPLSKTIPWSSCIDRPSTFHRSRTAARGALQAQPAAAGDQEELRRVSILQQIVPDHVPRNVIQDLEEVRPMQIEGSSLIRRLEALRSHYRLNPPDADDPTDDPADAEVVRIICSDGLVDA